MNKKWMILTCFFSVLTFISSVLCSSLVFYNEKVRTELNSSKVLANNNVYKSTSVIYNQSNNLKLSGLNPGYNLEQTFTITNNNSNTINYYLEWSNVTSTWNYSQTGLTPHPEEFVYSLSCSNGEKVENKTMPVGEDDYVILESMELKTNQSNDCTIKISFLNKEEDQSYNLNKSFAGTYKVVVKE